jgi:hypothetical protein
MIGLIVMDSTQFVMEQSLRSLSGQPFWSKLDFDL